jgi:cysteine synthase A
MKVVRDALGLIGNTPLLKLGRVTEGLDVSVYVKCEHLNPSGSIKDRMALRMVEEAEKEGRLRPGGTIIEQTSGNTGPALAFVGGVKGYRVRLFIPAQWTSTYSPTDRIRIMRFFGGEVEALDLADYRDFLKGLSDKEKAAAAIAVGMKKCYELEKSDSKVWWANQMCNIHNALAHRDTTGREILDQLDGEVDGWVASIGTGGTLLGVAEALRKGDASVRVVGVEPTDARVMDWVRSGTIHRFLEALGVPRMRFLTEMMLEKGLPDEVVTVTDGDAREMAYRLCREEGLFCGMSSGANVCAAVQTAKRLGRGARVVTVLVDRRDRYFSEHPAEHYVV